MKGKFRLWHSLAGMAALVVLEALATAVPWMFDTASVWLGAIAGSFVALYVATEVIEEVRIARHMLLLLSVVVGEFVVFFAFQYHFLLHMQPANFPTLGDDPLSLLLHSTMVFVFNPLYLPATPAASALLFINTLAALGLVLFILQNVWQFRRA
jgi:hypothetical protein